MKNLPSFPKIVLLLLITDGIMNAAPSSFKLAKSEMFLSGGSTFSYTKFFQFLGFYTIIYIFSAFLVYILLCVLLKVAAMFIKNKMSNMVSAGIILSLSCYILYAYYWSADSYLPYFYYRIFWYSLIGGILGWAFYLKEM